MTTKKKPTYEICSLCGGRGKEQGSEQRCRSCGGTGQRPVVKLSWSELLNPWGRLREIKVARQVIHDSFRRHDNGKCLCAYCEGDVDAMFELCAEYELDLHHAQANVIPSLKRQLVVWDHLLHPIRALRSGTSNHSA